MHNEKFFYNLKRNELKRFIQHNQINDYSFYPASDDFLKLNELLCKYDLLEEFWTSYLDNVISIDSAIIDWMIANDVCTTQLAHLDIDDVWLYALIRENVEAMQTLIIRYYTKGDIYYHSANASTEQFDSCMKKIVKCDVNNFLRDRYIQSWIRKLEADNFEKIAIMELYLRS